MCASVLITAMMLGVPSAVYLDLFSGKAPDAVSQASMKLPDQPSGDFIVLIKTSLHEDTIGDWCSFFNDDYAVIFDDISCTVAQGDAGGLQLAQRYQAQLPENQMTIREENAALLVSKAEAGYIDVAVFSREMADMLGLAPKEDLDGITVLEISGGSMQ